MGDHEHTALWPDGRTLVQVEFERSANPLLTGHHWSPPGDATCGGCRAGAEIAVLRPQESFADPPQRALPIRTFVRVNRSVSQPVDQTSSCVSHLVFLK